MSNQKTREKWILIGTVILLMLPLGLLGLYVAQKHRWAESRLAELEPRYARLLGLEAQRADIDQALVRAQTLRTQYVYPATQDATQTGNTAQQRVRDIFSGAGLQIISSQVLPPKLEKGFDRIPLTVRTEGELLALQSALAVLSSQVPVIVINELDIQVQGGLGNAKGVPRLGAQFTLSVLREHP